MGLCSMLGLVELVSKHPRPSLGDSRPAWERQELRANQSNGQEFVCRSSTNLSLAIAYLAAKPRPGNGTRPQWEGTEVTGMGVKVHECNLPGVVLALIPQPDLNSLSYLEYVLWPGLG